MFLSFYCLLDASGREIRCIFFVTRWIFSIARWIICLYQGVLVADLPKKLEIIFDYLANNGLK